MQEIKHGDTLLAIVDSSENFAPGLAFYGAKEDELQVGKFRYDEGKILRNHRHIKRVRTAQKTQEIMMVLKGSCLVRTFSETGKDLVDTRKLQAGQFYISYRGGVGFTILEDDTRLLEVKNGPYVVASDDEERELL